MDGGRAYMTSPADWFDRQDKRSVYVVTLTLRKRNGDVVREKKGGWVVFFIGSAGDTD